MRVGTGQSCFLRTAVRRHSATVKCKTNPKYLTAGNTLHKVLLDETARSFPFDASHPIVEAMACRDGNVELVIDALEHIGIDSSEAREGGAVGGGCEIVELILKIAFR